MNLQNTKIELIQWLTSINDTSLIKKEETINDEIPTHLFASL